MPGAWLYLVGMSRGADVRGLDGDGGISAQSDGPPLTIGREPHAQIVVNKPIIGGRRNSVLDHSGGHWRYVHLGHAVPIFHNDHLMTANAPAEPVEHGDLLGPVSVDSGRITFVFLEDAGTPRAAVLPSIERAIRYSFPDRAAKILREVGRWFASEPFAGAEGLAHVLHCALCGCFRRQDRVVLVEAFRPGAGKIQFQVVADFEVRIEPITYPSLGFCESCLADPDQTFRGADDADRLRADLKRALEAADLDERDLVTRELDRRFAFAQPLRSRGLCVLCLRREEDLPERSLRGCSGIVCRSCLHGASAVRHIRG